MSENTSDSASTNELPRNFDWATAEAKYYP